MERRVNYLLVGVFSLLLALGFAAFLVWTHQRGTGHANKTYAIFFDQAVNGLALGSAVRYLGVDAGQVEAITLDTQGGPVRVRILVGVDERVPLYDGTLATLKPSGVTGVSFIDLHTDPAKHGPLLAGADGVPVIQSESSGFDRLFDGANSSLAKVDLLLSNENLVLINKTFANLNHITGRIDTMLAAHEASLNRLLGPDVDELGETLRASRRTMDSITALTQSLGNNPSQIIFPNNAPGVRIDP